MLWIGRKTWEKFQAKWDERWDNILKHETTTNSEMGSVKSDVRWLVWQSRAIILGILGIAYAVIQKLISGA